MFDYTKVTDGLNALVKDIGVSIVDRGYIIVRSSEPENKKYCFRLIITSIESNHNYFTLWRALQEYFLQEANQQYLTLEFDSKPFLYYGDLYFSKAGADFFKELTRDEIKLNSFIKSLQEIMNEQRSETKPSEEQSSNPKSHANNKSSLFHTPSEAADLSDTGGDDLSDSEDETCTSTTPTTKL